MALSFDVADATIASAHDEEHGTTQAGALFQGEQVDGQNRPKCHSGASAKRE
jgi:hypothetical protein